MHELLCSLQINPYLAVHGYDAHVAVEDLDDFRELTRKLHNSGSAGNSEKFRKRYYCQVKAQQKQVNT